MAETDRRWSRSKEMGRVNSTVMNNAEMNKEKRRIMAREDEEPS